jgi:hypothetical protein
MPKLLFRLASAASIPTVLVWMLWGFWKTNLCIYNPHQPTLDHRYRIIAGRYVSCYIGEADNRMGILLIAVTCAFGAVAIGLFIASQVIRPDPSK